MHLYFEALAPPFPVSYRSLYNCLLLLTISMILVFFPARFFLATMYWARTTPPNKAHTLALAAAPTFTTAVLSMTVRCFLTDLPADRSVPSFLLSTDACLLAQSRNQRSSIQNVTSHYGGKMCVIFLRN